ncbi:aldehyde ferredoxin oxidoreductase family protein [Chloroflexota bacterium]
MPYLYGGTILRIDLSEGKISKELTAPYAKNFLGSRGINIKLLYDEVPPYTDAIDPSSPLIFGIGPLSGTPVPAGRTEVAAKSPETGFYGTSSFGGFFAPEVKFAGYDSIMVVGKSPKPVYIFIYNDQVEIRDASHIWGKDTYQTQEFLHKETTPEFKVACIGPAGEKLIRFATIQHELRHGTGRTGMGTVMGSKNLKAIVVRGTKGVNIAKPVEYLELAVKLQDELRNHPGVIDKQLHGHSYEQDWWRIRAVRGKVPQPVFSCDLFFKYQDKIKRNGCFSCPIQCMDLYPVEAHGGGSLSCSLYTAAHYWARNQDVEALLEYSLTALRQGIDAVTTIAIISWLMELYENGVITTKDTDGIPMTWGSKESIIRILKKIVKREGIGNILAEGIIPAAKTIGRGSEYYVNHMKGLPLYDVNTKEVIVPDKGIALSLAMSSRGDSMKAHTAILGEKGMADKVWLMYSEISGDEKKAQENIAVARAKIKTVAGSDTAAIADSYEGKPDITVWSEDFIIINDCLSTCKMTGTFLGFPFNEEYEAKFFSLGTGSETSIEDFMQIAKRIKNLERAYNVREGMTREIDKLPKRFMDNPVKIDENTTSLLETSKFEAMKDRYYQLRGWNIANGVPTRKTLEQYGMKYVADDLQRLGMLSEKSV